MEFGEMERNTSNWSNFCILLSRVGLSASAGLSCLHLLGCPYNTLTLPYEHVMCYGNLQPMLEQFCVHVNTQNGSASETVYQRTQ